MSNSSNDSHRVQNATEELRLLDLAAVVIREWRLISGAVLLCVLAGLGLYAAWPKSFTATTVLLPEQEQGGAQSHLLRSQLPPALLGLSSMGNPDLARVDAIAKSATFRDSMVARLGFEKKSEGAAQVARALRGARPSRAEGGSLVVQVKSQDPQLAAMIANEFASLVNALNVQIGVTGTLRKQEFLERQLSHARGKLEESERDLLSFQQDKDAPEMQEQARRTLDAAASLRQQIIQKEVEVAQLRRVATPDNPELRAAESELNGWRAQLGRLTGGQGNRGDMFFSLRESPELQFAATRLLRQYKQDEQVYLALAQSLVETQVSARNDLPVVSVLDPAEVPEYPTSYSTLLIVVLAAMLGFAVGLVLAFVREYARRARRDPGNERFFTELDRFKVDVVGRLPRRPGAGSRTAVGG